MVRLCGMSLSIISNRGTQFTSQFWKYFQKGFGTHVKLSTTFHLQYNRKAERTIKTLEDMMRACVILFKGNWDDHLPLIEFVYNNSYHSSIGKAPFEDLYGRRCRYPIGWFEVAEVSLIGPELVHEAMEKIELIRERLKTAQIRQKSYVDVRRKDLEFDVNDWVYLKFSPMKVFPVSLLKKCVGHLTSIVPFESLGIKDSLSYKEVPVKILDRQVRKLRNDEIASMKVVWMNQLVEGAT
ncbi:hypothetical protein MTR67_018639 [Solanum verrucosum]|uniref:Integrase catalytic domain-containing protein n=1 Tax=Solanum verrucosum TaxID=315347 RepID=A0AAF0TMV7_SOLVR|nr:hypothetical protein MTR67_018639 [Solanum verrucosum]